jgi:hypothetical protein
VKSIFVRVLLVSFLTTTVLSAPSLTLQVSPLFSFAPSTISIQVRAQRHDENRELCLEVDSQEGFGVRGCWPLDGLQAPITHFRQFKNLPFGQYTATAYTTRSGGTRLATATQKFDIMEGVPGAR